MNIRSYAQQKTVYDNVSMLPDILCMVLLTTQHFSRTYRGGKSMFEALSSDEQKCNLIRNFGKEERNEIQVWNKYTRERKKWLQVNFNSFY
jgi:hypothetical protein